MTIKGAILDLKEHYEKAKTAEALDHFMYASSPISPEAKKIFDMNCQKFYMGSDWVFDTYVVKLINRIKFLQDELRQIAENDDLESSPQVIANGALAWDGEAHKNMLGRV